MSELDHPLPVGTILDATDYDGLYKVIVDTGRQASGLSKYEVFTAGAADDDPVTQTKRDLDTIVSEDQYPDWTVRFRND